MPKITKQQLAIKLLFWLLPWPLSRPLPRILRELHYGLRDLIKIGLDRPPTDQELSKYRPGDPGELSVQRWEEIKKYKQIKPPGEPPKGYTTVVLDPATDSLTHIQESLADAITQATDLNLAAGFLSDLDSLYDALLDYLKSLSELKAILANVDQYTDPEISAAIQNAVGLHSTFFDLATALAIPAQYFYLIGEPVLTDLIQSIQDILSLISDISPALAAALQALLDALHVVEDFQDYTDQYLDPPPETHDPYGIIPHLSPGPAPGLPSSSKPTSKKWRWRDLTDSCCWSEGDSCSWDDVLRRWTFTNHGGNLYRNTSWTQSWRPTHYRITHTFDLIAFEIMDTSYNTLENIYNYASGAIRPITWFSNDLWFTSFYAPPPGYISKIEFYSLRIKC